jgi:hypothetical protein
MTNLGRNALVLASCLVALTAAAARADRVDVPAILGAATTSSIAIFCPSAKA